MKNKKSINLSFWALHIFLIVFLLAQLIYSPVTQQLAIIICASAYVVYGASLCMAYLLYSHFNMNDMRLFLGVISVAAGAACIAFTQEIYDNFYFSSVAFLIFSTFFMLQRAVNMMRIYKIGAKRTLFLSFLGILCGVLCLVFANKFTVYSQNTSIIAFLLLIFNSILWLVYGIIYSGKEKIKTALPRKLQPNNIPMPSEEDTMEFDALKLNVNYNTQETEKTAQAKNEQNSAWVILSPSDEELFCVPRAKASAHSNDDRVYFYAPANGDKITDKNKQNETLQ